MNSANLILWGRGLYVGISIVAVSAIASVFSGLYFGVDEPVSKSIQNLIALRVGISMLIVFTAAIALCVGFARLTPPAQQEARAQDAESET